LQFAKFSSACHQFDPRASHSGSISNYGSYSHHVYSLYHHWSQSPSSPWVQKALETLLVTLSSCFFHVSPCLMLVQGT
jgi:hypothetical protein